MIDAGGDAPDENESKPQKGTQQYFDVYLTRVDIGRFQPGGDFIFYKMQLVMDRSRELPILLTRWGRIGEQGAMQKTPYGSVREAVEEFKKVFLQKTGCRWCQQDKFKKQFGKFQLMRSNYVTLDQKNFLIPFSHDLQSLPTPFPQDLLSILADLTNVDTYLSALKSSGIDPKAMPFSHLDRKNLYSALDVLQSLQSTLVKLESMNPKPYGDKDKAQLLKQREKMWFLSSRFYEYIPHEEYRNKMVPPISNMNMLGQKSQTLLNLIQIEMASKILLGALYRSSNFNMNPLEYCASAAGVKLELLNHQSGEYKLIHQYALNTYLGANRKHLSHIVKLSKPVQDAQFEQSLGNRRLLFHGSKTPNYLGILSQGLRAQPLEVQKNGQLLGKGIYFTDMLTKAIMYTEGCSGSRYVLVCEVALGKSKEVTKHLNNEAIEEGFDSIIGLGKQGPSEETVWLEDGASVCAGKVKNYVGARQNSAFVYSEYVVREPTQVRMRYLLQFK
ncbi:hypothetical protein FGO68_gene9830 [Halteria grandinella]|uniref:Poly [ADP-ribose] polymerase n=1 Tax=Halteria grandinella TaxID=5974 RepID=A0A8J8SXB8_HALGN|nr:hypothetical protein FGO68_gene9830 [Halteria grandinella]